MIFEEKLSFERSDSLQEHWHPKSIIRPLSSQCISIQRREVVQDYLLFTHHTFKRDLLRVEPFWKHLVGLHRTALKGAGPEHVHTEVFGRIVIHEPEQKVPDQLRI